MSLSGALQAKMTKWLTREARLEAGETQDEDIGREAPLGTATRVGDKRASEVDDRLGNRGAESRTRLETDEPSVPVGDARPKGGGDTQTRTETEREEYR
jgi:hypothetical protein